MTISPEEIEKRKKMHQRNNNLLLDDDEEDDPGFDEDGNPITVEAARQLYHADNNALYIPKPKYSSPMAANNDLL